MISRCSFLIDSPSSMNDCARYSSSSGFDGRSPVMPKLLGVSTRPVPKCPFQMRLTITRVAIGCLTMASASSSRPLPLVNGAGSPALSTDRKCRGTSSPRLIRVAAHADLQVRPASRRPRRHGRRRTSAAAPCAAPRCRRAALRHSARRSALSWRSSPQPRNASSPGLIVVRSACAGSKPSCEVALEHVGPEVVRARPAGSSARGRSRDRSRRW